MSSSVIRIGAALASTYNSVFGQAEKKVYSLGRAYRETNKKLDASKEVIRYRNRLDELSKQQLAGKKVSIDAWKAAREGHQKATLAAHKYGLDLANIERQQRKLERQALGQRFSMGFSSAKAKIAPVGAAVFKIGAAATAAAGTLFGLTASTASYGDQVAKDSRKLGIGVEALQEYQYVAERSGVAGNVFTDSLQKQAKKVSEAANGMGEAQQAIAELGLDAEYLANLSPEKQFDLIADGLNQVGNQNDKIRIAQKLWEDAGVDLLNATDLGSEGMKRLREEGRKTGYVLSAEAAADAEEFSDAMKDTGSTLAGVRNQIGAALLPEVTVMMRDLATTIVENKDGIIEFARGVGMAAKLTGQVLGAAYDVIKPIGEAIGTAAGAIAVGVDKISNSAVGRWIAGKFSDDSAAANTVSKTAFAGASAVSGGGTTVNGGITVNAAPGMDEQALAEKVAAELDARDRRNASRRRGAHHD